MGSRPADLVYSNKEVQEPCLHGFGGIHVYHLFRYPEIKSITAERCLCCLFYSHHEKDIVQVIR